METTGAPTSRKKREMGGQRRAVGEAGNAKDEVVSLCTYHSDRPARSALCSESMIPVIHSDATHSPPDVWVINIGWPDLLRGISDITDCACEALQGNRGGTDINGDRRCVGSLGGRISTSISVEARGS